MDSTKNDGKIELQLKPYSDSDPFDLDAVLFRLDSQIDMLSTHADGIDYIVSIACGIVCSMLDVFWCGEIDLLDGRKIASQKVDDCVKGVAKRLGCKDSDDMKSAVRFLEDKFPLASDSNISDFGGGLQHHLRDFAHHPTIAGLVFSILTQFTYQSYGTDTDGNFITVDVTARGATHIGKTIPEKFVNGTVVWFFHLVSDMAGSSSTAGLSGGTGIPGPILSVAKEMSALPFFKNNNDDTSFSLFISKLFNGTLLAQHDENGKIIPDTKIKFDLRGELGLGIELSEQALPVMANECLVRCFYFIRHLAMEMCEKRVRHFKDFKLISWKNVLPGSNATLSRMLTVSTGVFTALDIGEAVVTQKYWVSVNYIGVGRFAVAIGEDISWCLKSRNLKKLKEMYSKIDQNTYRNSESSIYRKIENDFSDTVGGFALTIEQAEILYNIELYKTRHDIELSKVLPNEYKVRMYKNFWVVEWQKFLEDGFSSFLQMGDAKLHWYSIDELMERISESEPEKPWFRLVLFEAMLFEPYYAISVEKDKDENYIPSKKYDCLKNPANSFRKGEGDQYLERMFSRHYCEEGFIKRLRKSYEKCIRELNDILKKIMKITTVSAVVAAVAAATGGALAPYIATMLVGSRFVGLSGVALTNACLAYLGGGAVAAGGFGMAGGTLVIAGGGAALGFGVSGSIGGVASAVESTRESSIIEQSAKLIVSVTEIFLQDEHNVEFANRIYEQYLQNILEIEHYVVDLEFKRDALKGKDRKILDNQIKELKKTAKAMKVARKIMMKYHSSFEDGTDMESNISAKARTKSYTEYREMSTKENNKNILSETLDIFRQGYYEKEGRRIKLKTTDTQRKESIALLPDEVVDLIGQNDLTDFIRTENTSLSITVHNRDSFTSACAMNIGCRNYLRYGAGHVLVLNFANSIHPGGGVRNGARAQEEDLCRKSSLLLSLEDKSAGKYYSHNRRLNDRFGSDAVILTPYVEVIRDENYGLLEEPFIVSVLTCAAPNIRRSMEGRTQEEYEELFYRRIQNIFQIAFHFGYTCMVLGAWGCGAFCNDPDLVSEFFVRAMKEFRVPQKAADAYVSLEDVFNAIDFAVLDFNDRHGIYNAFSKKIISFHI